jgi:extradiol dioxygenase family protein
VSVLGVLPTETASGAADVDVHGDSIELHRYGQWTDPSQSVNEEHVVAQHVGVQGGHSSFLSLAKQ